MRWWGARDGWLTRARRDGAYQRFVDRTDDVMLGLSVVFVVVLVWPVLDQGLSASAREWFHWADVTIWVIFVVEYTTRFVLAPERARFVRDHLPDLVVVLIPPLRGLRIVAVLPRLLGLVSMVGRLSRQSLAVRTGTYTAILAIGVLFAGAVTVYGAERDHPDANIRTFPDAVWWAMTTMTTVGYGDRFPVTAQGRAMAAVLMLAGIAILGIVTASIAAWFIGQFTAVASAVEEEVDRDVEILSAVRELSQRLERLESRLDDVVGRVDDTRHAEKGRTGTEPALTRDDLGI
ncbi:potassium channel family protein [Cryptosporangium arvum]|uniref:Kef-type K+ ransport system, predicted NAD-binding component n=1 Tax=Cryptosporangium arvum DSM 44712 TaxID=927661 RepID=A0A010ZQ45_9ACTN|nr:potassium channel family protein [Cryptosporangium arvum]EXG80769.1 Kef-type K+ ransport system, predicted NAD-binding component [Cryptosporangium arvum DSM 44712]